MEFGDARVAEFRGKVLRVLLVFGMGLASVLMPAYYIIGIDTLLYACAIFFFSLAILNYQLRSGRWRQVVCARGALVATLGLMSLGLYFGTEVIDNKPWQILFPIVAFVLIGPREGVLWCLAALVGDVTILSMWVPEYSWLSIANFAIAHITTSYLVYLFTIRNEANIRTISKLSHTDSLTDTFNRQLFDELLAGEFNRARRSDESIAVYMIDIDHFKKYNDAYGHLAGDQALRNVAKVIKSSARRASDLVFRYGGEEFCVITSDVNVNDAQLVANSIIEGTRALGIEHRDGDNGQLTVSIGMSFHRGLGGYSAQLLLRRADEALYTAKSEGRDRLALYAPAENEQVDRPQTTL